ncbi:hypothetical protein EVY06_22730 [Citrobacter koseri]|uniref:Uncharacterized protein n=1 Tax=Citrobacter koseri TaxID=545 RepID=A0AAQ0V7V2_CITKO|nr:hypothetical protein AM351_13095 [Citrobacter koseri]QCQ71428.1 hypothetical protein FD428_10655 [Citrobacter sp. TBCP-5362]AVK74044.1 hypothetical protein CEP66_24710 [Citrobacter koseri]AYY75388.1 hypothetical protein EGX86_16745 [Citrobacter koseri]KXB44096.1 hypothetical protein HMPREF0208_02284 [Citrobacter koseri]
MSTVPVFYSPAVLHFFSIFICSLFQQTMTLNVLCPLIFLGVWLRILVAWYLVDLLMSPGIIPPAMRDNGC